MGLPRTGSCFGSRILTEALDPKPNEATAHSNKGIAVGHAAIGLAATNCFRTHKGQYQNYVLGVLKLIVGSKFPEAETRGDRCSVPLVSVESWSFHGYP